MDDALTERVEALERAVTDGEHDLSGLATDGEALDRLDRLEHRQDELKDRVAELEAATQALRGYVGNVRAVNEEVENRAETALAKVESLEATVGRQSEEPSSDGKTTSPRQDDGLRETGRGQSAGQNLGTGNSNPGKQRSSRSDTDGPPASWNDAGPDRCSTCGRAQPDAGPSPQGASSGVGRGDSHMDNTGELDSDSTKQLQQDDPLVSDEPDGGGSTLSRFKRLL